MKLFRKSIRCVWVLIFGLLLAVSSLGGSATAQTPTPSSTFLSETVVKALQEALIKQGIPIAVSGVLNEETRAAVRKFQTQHHLPVTGDPDKATLDKLGVPSGAASAPSSTLAQAVSPAGSGQMSGGMMMSGPMTQDHMRGMMQMMQGMMQMMQSQMLQPQIPPPQMSGGMMNGPMMQDHMRSMMQMMQGMMQMMQGQTQTPGQAQPDQMMPGQIPPKSP